MKIHSAISEFAHEERRTQQHFVTFQINLTLPCVVKLGPSLYDKRAYVRVNPVVSPSVLISFLCILSSAGPFFLTSLLLFVPHLRVSFQSFCTQTSTTALPSQIELTEGSYVKTKMERIKS